MNFKNALLLAALLFVPVAASTAEAQWVSVGVGYPGFRSYGMLPPFYARPIYPYGYGLYAPTPVYVVRPRVYYMPQPVVVARPYYYAAPPAAVFSTPQPPATSSIPVPAPAIAPSRQAPQTIPPPPPQPMSPSISPTAPVSPSSSPLSPPSPSPSAPPLKAPAPETIPAPPGQATFTEWPTIHSADVA